MQGQYDVAIVSVFGRGNWLADQLVRQKQKVVLLDVSDEIGKHAPEDCEGPFGFFHTEQIQSSQIERLSEETYHDPIDNGFTIWLKDGPIELKNNLTSYWLEQLELPEECQDYLLNYNSYTNRQVDHLKSIMKDQSFKKNWLVHLSHQLAGTQHLESAKAVNYGKPLPIFSPTHVRRVTRKGFDSSLDWCEQKGVKVYKKASIKDLRTSGRIVESVEVESSWSGVVTASQFVWELSSEETIRLKNKEIAQKLFPSGTVNPTWVWMRFRFRLSKEAPLQTLPRQFLVIDDIYLPWTHANMFFVQKSVSESEFDVWVKMPAQQRFQRSYVDDIKEQVCKSLNQRIPSAKAECSEMPADYREDYEVLGPARFPVFEPETISQRRVFKGKNIHYDTPEDWERMDWTGRFEYQDRLIKEILALKQGAKS